MTERKTASLNVRIRPAVKDVLKDAADRENRSLANMLEMMILDYRSAGRTGAIPKKQQVKKA